MNPLIHPMNPEYTAPDSALTRDEYNACVELKTAITKHPVDRGEDFATVIRQIAATLQTGEGETRADESADSEPEKVGNAGNPLTPPSTQEPTSLSDVGGFDPEAF